MNKPVNMKTFVSLALLVFIAISCSMSKEKSNFGEKKPQDPDHFIMSGELVEKEFYKKNGEPAGFTELYFRASIQDYFIKFCESKVTKKELEPYVDKVVRIEAEIRNGDWDICADDPQEMQSRIGSYLIIKKRY